MVATPVGTGHSMKTSVCCMTTAVLLAIVTEKESAVNTMQPWLARIRCINRRCCDILCTMWLEVSVDNDRNHVFNCNYKIYAMALELLSKIQVYFKFNLYV